ncbi:glucooligosaccharide oxidase-like isoform X1 [Folsomia candida]|uniref:glucooligosaccharide oxidase-like isoform X1 n=1 Tax=Folsomia candida TaxID=158441 RepID=UPI001604FC81|nr:glucooligosaccharide oxidase-like isoform X1 [Folsomia candida]
MRRTLAAARNIIVFALLLVVRNCHGKPGQQGTLSALKDCIVQAGSNASDIVEHDGPDYAKYSELNYQWNLIHEKKFPVAYFVVRSVTDVQNAVRCCTAQSVRIVAKGGGHSYEAYSFGDSTALIVDLQALHELVVSPDRQSFTIGSGALLGQLAYPLLEGYNLVTPQGTCPTVGIVGLATGGAISSHMTTFRHYISSSRRQFKACRTSS